MSQVRKFKDGGSNTAETTSKSKHNSKYGHYIVDGTTYDVNDDFIRDYIASAKQFDDNSTNTVASHVVNALKSGQDVSLDTLNNRIYGINNYLNSEDVERSNEYSQNSLNKKYQRKYRRKEARPNSSLHQLNIGISNLGSINFTNPVKKADQQSATSLIDLYRDTRNFDYNSNSDGTLVWSNGPQNAGNLAALNNFIDMLSMSEEDAKKKYNWTGYEDQINDLRTWYAGNQNYDWEGLRSRIKENQLDDADWDILRYMGFGENQPSSSSASNTDNTPRSYEGSGLNNDWLTRNNYYVQKGSDENTYLYRLGTDENGKPKYLIDTSAKIYLPNMGILGDNSQWNGGAIINGRFYTENEIWDPNSAAGQSFAELTRAWNSGSGETSWLNAKNTGWRFAGSDADNYMFSTYDRNTGTNPLWDQYFDQYKDDDNIWYVRNLANNFLGTPKGMEIISYIDQNNRSKAGYENPYFAVYNPIDKQFKRFENEEALSSYLQGLNIQKQSSLYSGDANFDIYDFLFDKNKNKYSYVSPINTFTGTGSSQQSTELYKGPDGNYYYLLDNSNPEDLQFIRIDDQNVINQILNGQTISNENLPSWAKRRLLERGKRRYMKQGGKIDFNKINYLQKHQYGGIFSNPYTGSTNKVERNKDAKITIGGSHQAFGGGKHGVRTEADKLANWATGFDTAAVGTSFIPVYGNIVGAASGLTGSALRFASDIKKDGFQGKDLWRFLGNVGLDALTLIPGLGSAAAGIKATKGASKVAKVASTIAKGAGKVSKWGDTTKVGKAVTYGLPAMGVLQGTSAAIQAATDGQPLTTDQLQTIAGGLIGGVILGNKAGKAFNNKALKSIQKELGLNKSKSYEYKSKDKTVSLSKDDINAIANKKVSEVNEFLYNKLKNAGIELEKPNFETATLWKDFGITANVSKKGIKGWWGNKLKIKQEKPNSIESSNLQNEDLAKRLTNPQSRIERRAQKAYSEQILQNPKLAAFVRKITGTKVRPQGQWAFGGWGTNWINRVKPIVSQRLATDSVNPVKSPVLLLPAWKGNNISEVNILPSSNSPITTPSSPLIQIPQYASSYRNAQGQFLLPRGDGRFFKRTQRVWNGGPAHEVIQLQPAKYSRTPRKSTRRNIGLEQAHKSKVLQEAGRQQMPVIRGLQEDIAKVRTSEDFKNLLFKINNRNSYKEIIKNNPEIKDQLRQMFIHLDPVRLGNWMTKYDLRFKKGGKIVKGQNGLKPGDLVYNNTSSPSYFDYNRSGIKFNGSNVDWTATYDPNSLYSKYRNIYLNNWNNPEFNIYKQAYLNQLSQGNSNIDVNNLSKDEFARITNDGLLGYAHNLYVDPNRDNGLYSLAMNQLPAATVTAKSNIKPIPQGKAVAQSSLGLIPNPALSNNNQVVEETKQSTRKSSGAGSQYTNANSVLKNLNFNPDDLFGLIETTRSIIANNQLYKDLKEANTAILKPYMPEIYDRYQDHITPIYQEAAKAKRNFVPTSTDSTVNYAMRQANEDAAQQLETKGRLKASEQYSQYLDKDLAARRAYAEDRRNTAFYNTQEMANKVMRDAQIEQGRKLANNQSISNYVMEMRNKFAQDRAKSQAFQKQQDALLAQQALNAEVNKAAQKWRTMFANMDPEERKARGYDSYEDIWLEQDPESYNNAYITGQLKAQQYLQDNQNKYIDYLFNKVPYVSLLANYKTPVSMPAYMSSFKSGGKTRKYIQRHNGPKPDEAIWIQRNKDTAKALEKLHDAVIKLFMKSIS